MKQSGSTSGYRNSAILILSLISMMAFVGYGAFTAASSTASRESASEQAGKAQKKAPLPQAPQAQVVGKPNVPSVAGVSATLTDNTLQATKVAPGSTINYTAVITSTGGAGENATAVNFNAALDANTTYTGGTVHASPIAFNDTYSWVGNTQLDTTARALPAVTANDVAVNATLPAPGTDTFNLVTQTNAPTALAGGLVTLNANGSFVYTPPVGRPNVADGASVNDSFAYTITNSADASLVGTGTVTITLTGRVWYLQAGAAGDGRSNTPSSSPSAMSTAADKSTDIFYIFSNAGSLNGLFSLDAGQTLLGQGVNLIVNTITLFTAAAPTPTTTNGAGNGVTLAGAPGNNTLSGFNIGACTALAIQGANVGTLTVSTLSINNPTGGGLDLTGVSTPTVNVVLGGLTAAGGATGATLNGMNGTITLAGGTLSGASGSEFAVNGGAATISYTGAITQNNAQRVVDVINTTGGSVTLSGTVTGGSSSTGVNLNADNGNVTFTTLNLGASGSRMTNQAVTINGGTGTYGLGAVAIFTNNANGLVANNADGTLNNTTGTVDSSNGAAISIDGPAGLTTLGLTFTKIDSAGGTTPGITIRETNGVFANVGGAANACTSAATCTGGSISGKTGASETTGTPGIRLITVTNIRLTRMNISGNNHSGIYAGTVAAGGVIGSEVINGFRLETCNIENNGDSLVSNPDEGGVDLYNLQGTAIGGANPTSINNTRIQNNKEVELLITNISGTLTDFQMNNDTVSSNNNDVANPHGDLVSFLNRSTTGASMTLNVVGGSFTGFTGLNNPNQLGTTANGIFADTSGSAGSPNSMTANVSGATFSHNNVAVGVSTAGTAGNLTFDIHDNPLITQTRSLGLNLFVAADSTGTVNGKFRNNVIGELGVASSGSDIGFGIRVQNEASSLTNPVNVLISGNTVQEFKSTSAITVNHGLNTLPSSKTTNVTITGNTIRNITSGVGTGNLRAIIIQQNNTTAPGIVCANISGNILTNIEGNTGDGTRIRLRQLAGGTVNITQTDVNNLAAVNGSTAAQMSLSGTITFNQPACVQPAAPIFEPPFVGSTKEQDITSHAQSFSPSDFVSSSPPTSGGTSSGVDRLVASDNEQGDGSNLIARITGSDAPGPHPIYAMDRFVRNESLIREPLLRGGPKMAFASFRPGPTLNESAKPASYSVAATPQKKAPSSPQSGETLNVPLGTLPGGKIVTIKYSATVNVPPLARQVSTQGTVSGSNFASVLTNDPDSAPANDPTVTLIDTLMTWNGVTSTDWNTATNWTQPAGGTQYAPGVSNPAINDVVIPNVGNQPTIGTTDIGIFSLNIANGRTLSITSPRVLTIGGSPGGDLTLDGIISGGNLNFGTGTHVINNAGGTGSLSSTNVATVLSGSTVTLNNNLQAGALAVNAGGSMNITNRTLSLNGSGAALVIPGGATFTTTGSTVVFNGAAAQQAAGIAYNNLTDANTAAALAVNANASIGGTLTVNLNAVLTPAAAVIISGAGTLTGNGTAQVTRTAATADFSSQYTITNKTLTNLTVEYIGAAAQTGSALTYGNLKINNAAGVTLAGNATVNGVLTLTSGDLNTTGAFTLTMPVAGTSAGTTDVVGNVKRTGFVINGAALSFGNPFNSIMINTGTTTAPTDINVNLDKAVPTTPAPFPGAIARKYTITPTGGAGISATLRLHYLDSELGSNVEGASLNLFRYDGSNWHKEGQTANDTANNWVEKNNVAQFSPWTMNSTVPTEATLELFNATGYDGGTLIEWRTGFEADNLGFNLYRDEGGKRVAVNSQMVAGSALVAGSGVAMRAGQSYAWWDGAASKSGAQYWLESIDLKGQSEWHGPFSSKFIGGGGPARTNSSMLGRGESAQAGLTLPVERAALAKAGTPAQIQLQSGLAGQVAVKMWVKREGFYRVTASELAGAGLDPKADSRMLQMYVDGQQIPINVISDKAGLLSAIEFYGRGLDAAFTDQRVYWLAAGSQPGLRIQQVKGEGRQTISQSFLYTAERKDRTIYFSGLRNGERENFFGAVIAATPVDQSLTLQHVDQLATGAATIEVALQGVTTLPHKVWVYLNGAFAGEMFFEGQAGAVSRFNIAQPLLRSGDNQVRLVAQAGPSDISLVDYIRLSYWHSYTADDNALRLTAIGNQEVTIGGFTKGAIRVLDVTDPDAVQELGAKIEQQKTGFAVTTASPGAGERRLLAMDSTQSSKPAKIAANQPSGWRTTGHSADFVIISRREFFSAIEPLKALRSKQGLKVELADIEDVFDEFSFGTKSPQAVKDFLLYATTSWKTKPRYVLLVGDASYDAKNYLGLGDSDLVPTRLIDTSLMETASDDWLADFNADGIADLAVGRLAARTPAEASTLVRKIIAYESSEPLESILLVADTNNGFDFESAATELRALIPGNLRVEQINRGQVGDATAKSRLIEAITRGQKVVNYMGHGSVNLWSGSLLTNEDAGNLTNGERLPVFVMMTCLNGYFHDPALDSLAESLLKAENGGAVAVWTSTGMTVPVEQSVLNQQLYRLLFTNGIAQGQALTLGDATVRAKAAVSDGDIRRTWVLLGDPTMRLK